jgi:mono/diheme cytochrome c family protein
VGRLLVVGATIATVVLGARVIAQSTTVKKPAAAPAGRADVGKTLYTRVGCYQCHVNQGQGGAAGPRIGPNPIPFAAFAAYVRRPTGDMPPYTEKVLSERDLADIYAFLQGLPRPPAVTSIPLLAP